jgi:hypothetical protein
MRGSGTSGTTHRCPKPTFGSRIRIHEQERDGFQAVEEAPPKELFEKLQPFKELVADDIERDD